MEERKSLLLIAEDDEECLRAMSSAIVNNPLFDSNKYDIFTTDGEGCRLYSEDFRRYLSPDRNASLLPSIIAGSFDGALRLGRWGWDTANWFYDIGDTFPMCYHGGTPLPENYGHLFDFKFDRDDAISKFMVNYLE
ncbi:MAG: hypothetical protein ACI83O_000530 [Patescibacteria group bacterium]|jgi:hypothetical protein